MVSALLANDKISFVVSKPFTSRGKTYEVGDDFDQADTDKIEVFVRARFVIPVVDSIEDKKFIRYWHKEIRPKDEVLAKLRHDGVQLRMPGDEPEAEETSDQPVSDAHFDPTEHTVNEVLDYLGDHPEDEERVLAIERTDRQRKGILGDE